MREVLLYDGACGLCAGSVRFVLRHDTHGTLRFASLQGEFGQQVLARHPELAGVDSMIWLQPASATAPERVAIRSDAALDVLRYLGGWWSLLLAVHIVPRPLRDAAYDLIAAHRHRVTRARCPVPDGADRHRFLW